MARYTPRMRAGSVTRVTTVPAVLPGHRRLTVRASVVTLVASTGAPAAHRLGTQVGIAVIRIGVASNFATDGARISSVRWATSKALAVGEGIQLAVFLHHSEAQLYCTEYDFPRSL